jgi:type I restriction-modification system DNA methylase subunit
MISLSADNLEFPDTVGAAYDRFLARMTDMMGKLGSVLSTPHSVAELMVRITAPAAGESVCDPFAGLGGFLTSARDYVRETSGDAAEVDWNTTDLMSCSIGGLPCRGANVTALPCSSLRQRPRKPAAY